MQSALPNPEGETMTHTWDCAVTLWWQAPKRGDGPEPPPCTCGKGTKQCTFCGEDIFWMPQHGGWNAQFGDQWCPQRDALLEGPFRGEVPERLPHQPC